MDCRNEIPELKEKTTNSLSHGAWPRGPVPRRRNIHYAWFLCHGAKPRGSTTKPRGSTRNFFYYRGVPGIFFALGSSGGRSRHKYANKSAISCGRSCFSTSSGMSESLLRKI